MTNFQKITESVEALGKFLESVQTPEGPWDVAFRERYCAVCEREDCDSKEGGCPHERERNNPLWWLRLNAEMQELDEVTDVSAMMRPTMTGVWVKGKCGPCRFAGLVFKAPSKFGIDEGRVSKLEIWHEIPGGPKECLFRYDRGWDHQTVGEIPQRVFSTVMAFLENMANREGLWI